MKVFNHHDERPVTNEELTELWKDAPGTPGFFSTVDHKRIGIRYIVTSFAFFFIAGLLALVMRTQLAQPNHLDKNPAPIR